MGLSLTWELLPAVSSYRMDMSISGNACGEIFVNSHFKVWKKSSNEVWRNYKLKVEKWGYLMTSFLLNTITVLTVTFLWHCVLSWVKLRSMSVYFKCLGFINLLRPGMPREPPHYWQFIESSWQFFINRTIFSNRFTYYIVIFFNFFVSYIYYVTKN